MNPGSQPDSAGTPYGIRTRVTGVKGRRPRPLDEGGSAADDSTERTVYGLGATSVAAMRSSVRLFSAAAAGYLIGSYPSADLATRIATGNRDLHTEGTGNPGGMNASHVLGKKWGLLVTSADVGKGVLAARLGRSLAGDTGAHVASTASVIGHCHPPGRAGGKGVATSIGQVIATFPSYLPIDMAIGVATSAIPWFKQRTRTATSVASAAWVGCGMLWWRRGLPNPGGTAPDVGLPLAAAASSLVIAERFRAETHRVAAYNNSLEEASTS